MPLVGKAYRPTFAMLLIVMVSAALVYMEAWPVIYGIFIIAFVVFIARRFLAPLS